MKDLDVNSSKQELANKDKDANLRCVNDPGETKKGQSGAVKIQRSCIYLYERWIGTVRIANNSYFTGLG